MRPELGKLVDLQNLSEKYILVRWLLGLVEKDYGYEQQKKLRLKLEREQPKLVWWSGGKI